VRRRAAYILLLLLLSAAGARRAAAQFTFIERLIDRFSDFNVNFIYGSLTPRMPALSAGSRKGPPRSWGIRGVGVEFAFGVGDIRRTITPADSATGAEAEEEIIAYFDLALGYSQLWGYEATDTTMQFTGSIRELPNATMYVSFYPQRLYTPYVGLRTGIVQLHQASIYDDSLRTAARTQYAVNGQSFQLAGVGGVITYILGFNVFFEFAYAHRYFAGLVYSSKDNTVPARFPRSMNMSGFQIATGVQVRVPR
jgi:hypothetical protein